MKSYTKSVVCILLAAALWGSVSIFLTRLTSLGITRYQVIALRCLFATILFGAFLLVKERKLPTFQVHHIWCFLGTGILNQLLFCICYYTAIPMIGVSVASILMYTSPIFAVVLSAILFKERIGKRGFYSLILALMGCVLVSGLGGAQQLPAVGLLLGLASGLAYAMSGIFNKFALQRGYSSSTITFYTSLFCMLGAIPLAAAQPFPVLAVPETASAVGALLGMSLLCGIMPTMLYATGLKQIGPGRASMLTSAEPAVATLLGVFWFHERLTVLALIGIILIIIAVINLASEDEKQKEEPSVWNSKQNV